MWCNTQYNTWQSSSTTSSTIDLYTWPWEKNARPCNFVGPFESPECVITQWDLWWCGKCLSDLTTCWPPVFTLKCTLIGSSAPDNHKLPNVNCVKEYFYYHLFVSEIKWYDWNRLCFEIQYLCAWNHWDKMQEKFTWKHSEQMLSIIIHIL